LKVIENIKAFLIQKYVCQLLKDTNNDPLKAKIEIALSVLPDTKLVKK